MVLSMGRSQWGNRTLLLMDYDQECVGKSEGGGGDKLRVEDDRGEKKKKEKEKNVQ